MPDELIDEVVTLVRKNGQKVAGIQAAVRPKLIFIADDSVRIEEGDKLTRKLPNGGEEVFLVRDRGYVPKSGLLPAHYQVKVERESVAEGTGPGSIGPVYPWQDPSGPAAAVGARGMFQALRRVIVEQVAREETPPWIAAVDEMERAVGTPAYLTAYQRFILRAADRIGLIAPFIPALTQLLG
jgi:hypothetical protein